MKKISKILALSILGVFFLAGNAIAIPIVGDLAIDFRTSDWAPAYNQASYTVGNVTGDALPDGNLFYQDSDDGLGILGGENDEIDTLERIRITLSGGGMWLTGAWVTDLFAKDDGNLPNGEQGNVKLNADASLIFTFYGDNSDQGNGEQWVDFGGPILVTKAVFRVENITNNEYSVAGFTAVPEPATMLLLGFGLLGIGLARRKHS